MTMKLRTYSILLFLFALSSCIQIPVGVEKIEQSKNVMFKSPKPFFEKTTGFTSDHAWIHSKTGSIISYKSECSKQSLDSKDFLQNIVNEFSTIKATEAQSFKFNSRKAFRQKLMTEVEGVPTNFDLVVFKKYGCLFMITHSGLSKTFSQTEEAYKKFLISFKVQR
jgi:PBP1b-binding outer membrane lipoprotein LpoB